MKRKIKKEKRTSFSEKTIMTGHTGSSACVFINQVTLDVNFNLYLPERQKSNFLNIIIPIFDNIFQWLLVKNLTLLEIGSI